MIVKLVALCGLAALLALGGCTMAPREQSSPTLRVVCFGDSITGFRPREPYISMYLKWSDLLGLMLEAKVGPQTRVEVLNRGFAGDTTYARPSDPGTGAIHRLPTDILAEKPDIAVIMIGGNDQKDTPEERQLTKTNLQKIVHDTKAAGIRVLLLQYAVLGPTATTQPAGASAPHDTTWYSLAKNNDLIAAVAAAEDVPLLPLQPAYDAALQTYPRTSLVNAADGVHLNPAGEMTVARAIFTKLESLGWIKK